MRLAIRAARDHRAQSRLVAVAKQLAGMLPIPEGMAAAIQTQKGDEQTRAMAQREALADLLEAVVRVLLDAKAEAEAVAAAAAEAAPEEPKETQEPKKRGRAK